MGSGRKADVTCEPHQDGVSPRSRARVVMLLNDAYLPLDDLATYSGLSRRMLEEYIRDAIAPLPHYKFGTRVVVRRSDFDEWAQRHRVKKESVDIKALVDAKIAGR